MVVLFCQRMFLFIENAYQSSPWVIGHHVSVFQMLLGKKVLFASGHATFFVSSDSFKKKFKYMTLRK